MAPRKIFPDPNKSQFENFIRAGIGDLGRILDEAPFRPTTDERLPAVAQAAQLSMFLLLITRGIEPKHTVIFPHSDRLSASLDKIYRQSKACWQDALKAKSEAARTKRLRDTSQIEPQILKLVRFAKKNFGETLVSLRELGVNDVQLALASLSEKIAAGAEASLGLGAHAAKKSKTAKKVDVSSAILGGLLVAKIGADAGLRGSVTRDHVMATRAGVSIGLAKTTDKKSETAGTKKLQRTLKSMAENI
jgi:hypothetical protein